MKTLIYRGEKAGANLGGLFLHQDPPFLVQFYSFQYHSLLFNKLLLKIISFLCWFIFLIQFAEIVQLNLIISIFGIFIVVIMRTRLFSQLLMHNFFFPTFLPFLPFHKSFFSILVLVFENLN